jgi:two-component system sensor histidine kinase KdpD
VHVDGSLVLQVFTNLLENVVKHTPLGTRVTVSAAPEGAFVRVSIDDTGPGLPPGILSGFSQSSIAAATKAARAAPALGLSICRAILMAHGGQIDASQRPGGGARFSFTLPVS